MDLAEVLEMARAAAKHAHELEKILRELVTAGATVTTPTWEVIEVLATGERRLLVNAELEVTWSPVRPEVPAFGTITVCPPSVKPARIWEAMVDASTCRFCRERAGSPFRRTDPPGCTSERCRCIAVTPST
jgi:hypothetical protein